MKSNSTIAGRQNHAQAITLIKASYRCYRAERVIKYIMIFLSFGICLAAIFNRYLPTMLHGVPETFVDKLQQNLSTYLNLASGGIIVAGLLLGFYCNRMHTEGTVLRDRYDAYVFNNRENSSILRPISDAYVELYAKKVHKHDKEFYDYIYGNEQPTEDAFAQFEYIAKEARSDYDLYVSIKPFFYTIWVGFCILIIVIAVSFNDMFVTTLINIMIPSLSAITTIGSSWYNYRLQMKQLVNLMNCVKQIQALPPDKFKLYITDKDKMRQLADGLFNYRSSAFVIPNFLVNHHRKSIERAKAKLAAEAEKAAVADKLSTAAAKPVGSATSSVTATAKSKASVKTESASRRTEKTTAAKKETTKQGTTGQSTVRKKTTNNSKTAGSATTAAATKQQKAKGTATPKLNTARQPKKSAANKK